MNVEIDFSVFTKANSLGRIHGSIELNNKPEVGQAVEISLSKTLDKKFKVDFLSELKVEGKNYLLIMLEDLIVDTHKEFLEIGKFLEKRYGLYIDDNTEIDN